MKIAQAFSGKGVEEIKSALDGGRLVVYSVARPSSPESKVERSGLLATFQFGAPAFDSGSPSFAENPVVASGIGTPGFARAFAADGTAVADFSAGAGKAEVKLSEVSATANYPIALTGLRIELPAD